jgi:hypothetical protein
MAVIYLLFLILFFLVIEPRFTCSHCPYYAEKRKIQNCTSNIITPKLWKYHPEPMNTYEKIGSTIGFIFLAVFPLATELYGILFLIKDSTNTTFLPLLGLSVITLASFGSIILFFIAFLVFYCPYCLNFSCQFNKAPKNLVKIYLEKNLVIKNPINTTFLPLLELSVITLASFGSIILFFIVFLVFYCPYCVNFSCQFNRAPKNLAKNYIEKNLVIKNVMNRTENQKP